MNIYILRYPVLLLIFAFILFENTPAQDAKSDSSEVTLELVPTAETYELEEGFDGEITYKDKFVNFDAVIQNDTDSTIIIAHPTACAPDSSKNPPPWTIEDRMGHAEILLHITEPDGNKLTLREGGFAFFERVSGTERSTIPYIMIPPDSSRSFGVGWFFLNARGRWARDDIAAHIFKQRGEFEVQLVYTNVFTSSCIDFGIDDIQKLPEMLWTGSLVSNKVKITMK